MLFLILRGWKMRLSIPGKNSTHRTRSALTVDMGGNYSSTSIRGRRKSKKSSNGEISRHYNIFPRIYTFFPMNWAIFHEIFSKNVKYSFTFQ